MRAIPTRFAQPGLRGFRAALGTLHVLPTFRSLGTLATAAVLCSAAAAQTAPPASAPGPASRIDKVTLYQGSATVERTLALSAGAREALFVCLPASLDTASLQVQSDAGVRIGDVRVDTTERALTPECAGAQETRIRSLEDDLARIKAATTALALADSYLKNVATSPTPDGKTGPAPTAAQIDAIALALRRGAEDNQVRAHQLAREKEALELRLRALQAEQNRTAARRSKVVSVRVQLATQQPATLRLAYQVRGPNWQSSYRATLDAEKETVRIERQAIVAQASGEDWGDVQLRLSTGTPQRSTQGQLPRPWRLTLAPPPRPQARADGAMMEKSLAMAPAAAPSAEPSGALADAALPDFEVQTHDGTYATEFVVPGRTSVPSSGERVTLALGDTQARARLLARTAPEVEQAAYLVAEIPRPPGVWPPGPVALVQGKRFVGNGRLDFTSSSPASSAASSTVTSSTNTAANTAAKTANGKQAGSNAPGVNNAAVAELSFGVDDKVTVRADERQQTSGTAGLTGSRTERTEQSRYRINNLHTNAIELQVLHAAPVSQDEKIEVQSRYTPDIASPAFAGRPGTVLWQQTLAAGASASFAAEHTLLYPKDAPLRENR